MSSSDSDSGSGAETAPKTAAKANDKPSKEKGKVAAAGKKRGAPAAQEKPSSKKSKASKKSRSDNSSNSGSGGGSGSSGDEIDQDGAGDVPKKLELGNKRFVSINVFKGRKFVDVREHYMDGSGELKPGKKGISLSVEQYRTLMKGADTINKMIDAAD